MLLHYIVMYCVDLGCMELPVNFCSHTFISQVVNYSGMTTWSHPLIKEAITAYGSNAFIPLFDLTRRSWLFGYLEVMIQGSNFVESSTILKWRAVIKDSINASYAIIHLRRASRQATSRTKKRYAVNFFLSLAPGSRSCPNFAELWAACLFSWWKQGELTKVVAHIIISAKVGEFVPLFGHMALLLYVGIVPLSQNGLVRTCCALCSVWQKNWRETSSSQVGESQLLESTAIFYSLEQATSKLLEGAIINN